MDFAAYRPTRATSVSERRMSRFLRSAESALPEHAMRTIPTAKAKIEILEGFRRLDMAWSGKLRYPGSIGEPFRLELDEKSRVFECVQVVFDEVDEQRIVGG